MKHVGCNRCGGNWEHEGEPLCSQLTVQIAALKAEIERLQAVNVRLVSQHPASRAVMATLEYENGKLRGMLTAAHAKIKVE